MMNKFGLTALTLLLSCNSFAYNGSSPKEVWEQITSDTYNEIPTERITLSKVYKKIFNRASETVNDQEDIIPYFNKLLHTNGVCMLGKWKVDQENPYSGYFKKGSEAITIARASTTLSGVKRGEKRGFAMALKLFPTKNEQDTNLYKTAQIFTIDTLAGNKLSHYSKSAMTNSPKTGFTFNAALAAIVGVAFTKADKNPNIRQLYQVAELGELDPGKAITPRYIKIQADQNMIKSNKRDFRDELIDTLKANTYLKFIISVSKDKKEFQRIGSVTFSEIAASESCDHRLHFHHLKFRDDINHL